MKRKLKRKLLTKINYNLSILIPAWNAEKYIEGCLNSILENDYDHYKIIIIAGGIDNSLNIALRFQNEHPNKVKTLEQRIPHKNKALNEGLKEVDGDIIIITDIDCIYRKNWLNRINEIFQNKKYNVITSHALPYQWRKNALAEFNRIRSGNHLVNNEDSKIITGKKLWGGNSAFRTKIFFEKIEKFDEIARTGDDKILGMQFNERGEDVFFFRDIWVYSEFYSNNLKKFIQSRIRWARDEFIPLKKKHFFKILILLGIGLFKLFYPLVAIIIALLFFNVTYIWLFLLPWFVIYIYFLILNYFQIKKLSIKINTTLHTNINYKKAFKVMPILFFVFGIISVISFINPSQKKRKWLSLDK